MAKVDSVPVLTIVRRVDTVIVDGFYWRKIYIDGQFVHQYCLGRVPISSPVPRGTQPLTLFDHETS